MCHAHPAFPWFPFRLTGASGGQFIKCGADHWKRRTTRDFAKRIARSDAARGTHCVQALSRPLYRSFWRCCFDCLLSAERVSRNTSTRRAARKARSRNGTVGRDRMCTNSPENGRRSGSACGADVRTVYALRTIHKIIRMTMMTPIIPPPIYMRISF